MITRKQLEEYRSGTKEVRELRARMRTAELEALHSGRKEDEERARRAAAEYDALAEIRELELMQILAAIDALENVQHRRALMLIYVDGLSRTAAAMRMERSPEAIDKYIAAAIKELEKE